MRRDELPGDRGAAVQTAPPQKRRMSMTLVEEPGTTAETVAAVDGDKLMAFVFRAIEEVGATLNAQLVVMGDKLGYYRALAADGPSTPSELARRTGTGEK